MNRQEFLISRSVKHKLIRWATISSKEIAFVCAGKENRITKVRRIRNTACPPFDPRAYIFWNLRELAFVRGELKKVGLKILMEGHSHPGKCHPPHPSQIDVDWMKTGHLEMIVCPHARHKVTAWRIRKSHQATLRKGKIHLIEF